MGLTDQTVNRNTDTSFDITFTDESTGNPIDITGYEVWFTVRTSVPSTGTSDDTDAIISKVYTDGDDTGIITVELSEDETNIDPITYKYDVQYRKADTKLKNSGVYDFIVLPDVTRSV